MKLALQKELLSAHGPFNLEVEMAIPAGTFATLYGKSGAGKTSVLRMIAGLMQADHGSIHVGDVSWLDTTNRINLPPQRRNVGFVFQESALFPNMTVAENLHFAADASGKQMVAELIDRIDLNALAERKPDTLSGGQKQRVALARALVQRPKVLLLDEPLSSLDASVRVELQNLIREMHDAYSLTTILVSHDMAEVHKLSDKVFVLEHGRIIRTGRPMDVFFDQQISGKFKFTGEILSIEADGVVYIVSVLVQQQIVKVIAQSSDLEGLDIGDRVLVASKAFNPVLFKLDD